MLIGYARVSNADGSQSLAVPRDALQAAGVDAGHVYHDVASGVRDDRPGLDSEMVAAASGTPVLAVAFRGRNAGASRFPTGEAAFPRLRESCCTVARRHQGPKQTARDSLSDSLRTGRYSFFTDACGILGCRIYKQYSTVGRWRTYRGWRSTETTTGSISSIRSASERTYR